jgi:hypothetical protein
MRRKKRTPQLAADWPPHNAGLNEAVRAPPPFGKSVETPVGKLLQNNRKPKRIVTNIEPKARQTRNKKGFMSRPGAHKQKERDDR